LAIDLLADFRRPRTPAHSQLYGRVALLAMAVGGAIVAGWLILWALPIKDFGCWDSFVFATSQILVGGSSVDFNAGYSHLVELALQAIAVFAVATLAGALGAFFHRRGLERQPLASNGDRSSTIP
jgi:hypothetical protein